jgi:hypothetical protein
LLKAIPLAIVVTIVTSACATSGTNRDSVTARPELWSDHKLLKVPVDVCGERAFNVLTALAYENVVRNGNYSYGDFKGNRAAVKCVETAEGSFLYFAVAGPRKETVEQLRNQLGRTL